MNKIIELRSSYKDVHFWLCEIIEAIDNKDIKDKFANISCIANEKKEFFLNCNYKSDLNNRICDVANNVFTSRF